MSYGSLFLQSSSALKRFTRQKMEEGLYTKPVILGVWNAIGSTRGRYLTPVDVASKIRKYGRDMKVVRQKVWGRRYPLDLLAWPDFVKICEHAREDGDIGNFSKKKLKQVLDEIYRSLLIL